MFSDGIHVGGVPEGPVEEKVPFRRTRGRRRCILSSHGPMRDACVESDPQRHQGMRIHYASAESLLSSLSTFHTRSPASKSEKMLYIIPCSSRKTFSAIMKAS